MIMETYILTIGYPEIETKIEGKLKAVDDALTIHNLHDYHIVLAKDPKVFSKRQHLFADLKTFTGVFAIGLWPIGCFKTSDGKFYKRQDFDKQSYRPQGDLEDFYSYAMKNYVKTDVVQGENLVFDNKHWAGKIFEKHKKCLSYAACFALEKPLKQYALTMQALQSLQTSQLSSAQTQRKYDSVLETFASAPGHENPVGGIIRTGKCVLLLHPLIKDNVTEDSMKELVPKLIAGIQSNLLGLNRINPERPRWAYDAFPEHSKIMSSLAKEYWEQKEKLDKLSDVLWQTGEPLEIAIEYLLNENGLKVSNIAKKGEQKDLVITTTDLEEYIVEVKGLNGPADINDVSKFLANNPQKNLIMVVNHYRLTDWKTRNGEKEIYIPFTPAAIDTIKKQIGSKSIKSFYPISTLEFIDALNNELKGPDIIREFQLISQRRLGKP